MTFVEFITGLGTIIGIFATALFASYRYLVQQMRTDRKFMEDRLTGVLAAYNESQLSNTKALTELITWLRTRNGNK